MDEETEKEIREIAREEARRIADDLKTQIIKEARRISQNEAYALDLQLKEVILKELRKR